MTGPEQLLAERLVDRRSVLAMAGGMAAAVAAGPAFAEPFFRRHRLDIGVQLYSVKAEAQKDLGGALKSLAMIGFRVVQLSSFFGRPPAEIRAELNAARLTCNSAHLQHGRAAAS